MKKIVFLLFFAASVSQAYAQNENFEYADEALGNIQPIQMPKCSDQNFETKIVEAAKTYFEKNPAVSTANKRQKRLKLMNLKNFEQISAKGFSPKEDIQTANALITIKINEHIQEKDILLCRHHESEKSALYIIAYPYMDNIKVHIINLDEKNPNYQAVSFIYP